MTEEVTSPAAGMEDVLRRLEEAKQQLLDSLERCDPVRFAWECSDGDSLKRILERTADESRPLWLEGFVNKTIIPMVEGVKEVALAEGMIDAATWEQGIRDLHATGTPPEGVFCYTFFKGVAVK